MKTNPQKKLRSRRCAFAFALSVVALLTVLLLSRSPLPAWGGKSLAQWFDQQVREEFVMFEPGVETLRPETAIRELAGEAVPFLMQKARQNEPKLVKLYGDALLGLPDCIAQRLPASDCGHVALERCVALNLLAQILGNGTNSSGGNKDLKPAQATMISEYLAAVWKTNELESARS